MKNDEALWGFIDALASITIPDDVIEEQEEAMGVVSSEDDLGEIAGQIEALQEKTSAITSRSKTNSLHIQGLLGNDEPEMLPDVPFWAEITGSTSLGNNQWTYSFKEKKKTSAGYGGWEDISGGRTGTDTAYNFIENMNDGLTTEGNGVDLDNLDTADYTFTIQPAPAGVIVELGAVWNGATEEYWFGYCNGIDGTCD